MNAAGNTLVIYQDLADPKLAKGAFKLGQVGFGRYTPSNSEYFFQPLGYDGYYSGLLFAYNFQGLGLPLYLYNQFLNLLYKINAQYDFKPGP